MPTTASFRTPSLWDVPGKPFQWLGSLSSMKAALDYADVEVTEAELRSTLVHAYLALDEAPRREAAQRKLSDPLSYFHLTRYPNVEAVLEHWRWYLYCLTFETRDFTSDKNQWNRLPDFVDLEVLASSFQLRLTVIQLSCPPVTFGFGWSRRAELVVHEGLWAPMLGPSRFSYDSMCVHDVVELADTLPEYLESFVGESGCVLEYNFIEDYYKICVGQHVLPIPREHIKRILTNYCGKPRFHFTHRRTSDIKCGPGPGQAPLLAGIPDGEVEFQLLLELVVHEAKSHLEEIKEHLSGQVGVKPDPMRDYQEALNALAPLPLAEMEVVPFEWPRKPPPKAPAAELFDRHMPLEEVQKLLDSSYHPWVKCVQSFEPRSSKDDQAFLPCRRDDFICLVKAGSASEDGSLNFFARTPTSRELTKLISSDQICKYTVQKDFAPKSDWPHQAEEFLTVKRGDVILICQRLGDLWKNWALGKLANGGEKSGKEGLLPLGILEANVFVKQCQRSEG
ncbi:Ankyrin repeat and KH domain-containing protein mask [Durusdinium trenchii]|uniref:Ankyrin repeat and KH domain-containing protein mask n=1 Tax=Durusdinium trenchii TaxID=1381693 RepID=A0ABP0LXA4_9DINO